MKPTPAGLSLPGRRHPCARHGSEAGTLGARRAARESARAWRVSPRRATALSGSALPLGLCIRPASCHRQPCSLFPAGPSESSVKTENTLINVTGNTALAPPGALHPPAETPPCPAPAPPSPCDAAPRRAPWAAQWAWDAQRGLVPRASPVGAFPDGDSVTITLGTAGRSGPPQAARPRPLAAGEAPSQRLGDRLARRPRRGGPALTRAVVRTRRRAWEARGTEIRHLTAGV